MRQPVVTLGDMVDDAIEAMRVEIDLGKPPRVEFLLNTATRLRWAHNKAVSHAKDAMWVDADKAKRDKFMTDALSCPLRS